jgi:hypothetical protein
MLLLSNGKAHAYIDPGTGGMLYQIIILIFGAAVAYFAIFKRYIKNFFSKKKDVDEEDK